MGLACYVGPMESHGRAGPLVLPGLESTLIECRYRRFMGRFVSRGDHGKLRTSEAARPYRDWNRRYRRIMGLACYGGDHGEVTDERVRSSLPW